MGDLDGYFEPIDREMARVERIIAALEAKNTELQSALAKSASREAALVEKLKAAEEALNDIASWREGPNVTSSFDEPASAGIARIALAKEAS